MDRDQNEEDESELSVSEVHWCRKDIIAGRKRASDRFFTTEARRHGARQLLEKPSVDARSNTEPVGIEKH
jgi:hypothetical protein